MQTIVMRYFIVFTLLFSTVHIFTSIIKVNLFTTLESVHQTITKN